MGRIITFSFNQDFIACLGDYLHKNYCRAEKNLSRIAVVFGGKRPALFLKKELAEKIGSAFIPPGFFSMDEFVKFVAAKDKNIRFCHDLDAAYLIYNAARLVAPGVLSRREEFADFLPWAKEISSFIDELDLEDVAAERLKEIQLNAGIGYEIPESINKLLTHITGIVGKYHKSLVERNMFSRGLLYREAGLKVRDISLEEFDKILFCNFYYMHKSEETIIKCLFDANKADLFMQKDRRPWPVFERLSRVFQAPIEPAELGQAQNEVKIYKGFDTHSQVGLVRTILEKEITGNNLSLDKTLVLLSEPDNLVPLLSEISGNISGFNVSMGYPLKRSSFFNLLRYIFKAQLSAKENAYYSRDYLRVMLHPLIKNIMLFNDPAVSRIIAHKIEEMFLGMSKSRLSGSLFASLKDIEDCEELYNFSLDTLLGLEIKIDRLALKKVLCQMHNLAFRNWEDITSFGRLITVLEEFLSSMVAKSFIGAHPLNIKVTERVYEIIDELKNSEFRDLAFPKEEIFKIFESKLKDDLVSFRGSPLGGLQILGLLETRSLTFENVIVMDANEGILPNVSVYEPLIPRQVMEGLGLERLKQEEEIQRYHFMRLISGAKRAYFVYDNSPEKERSRFLEEIIWERQKKEGSPEIILASVEASYNVASFTKQDEPVKKSLETAEFLTKKFEFSPSSIDTYLHCPLKFYYRHVLRLKEKEDLLNEPEGKEIGNFIHNLLNCTFRRFLDKSPVLDSKFEKDFFEEFDRRFLEEIKKRISSEAFMVKDIMRYRLERFLEFERKRKIKSLLLLEEAYPVGIIRLGGKEFKFKYRIDRVDLLGDDSILVLDYKTGSNVLGPNRLESLEMMELTRQGIKKGIHSFQLPVYYYFTRMKFEQKPLNAALYGLRDMSLSYFIRENKPDVADKVLEICMRSLEVILSEITDQGIDFYPDKSDERACQLCPFSSMCK